MILVKSFLAIILTSVLTENFVLCKFLGICPFLGVSKKLNIDYFSFEVLSLNKLLILE